MTVLYNERAVPLAKNPSKPDWSNGLVLAYDFTGHDAARSDGKPWIYQGATAPNLVKSGTQALTTVAGEPGVVASASANYSYSNTTDYGLQVGMGDFTLAVRFTTPETLPTTSQLRTLINIRNGATSALALNVVENPGIGWYITASGSTAAPLGSTVTPMYFPTNARVVVIAQRISGVLRIYTANADGADAQLRYNAGAAATAAFNTTNAAGLLINSNSTGVNVNVALQSIRFWNVGLDTPTVTALAKDYWAAEANSAIVKTITITTPDGNDTISTTSVISGTYTGAAPAGVAVQHGSGSWVAGTSMTIGGGNWSGNFTLSAGASNTLRARETDDTSVVSPDIADIVVQAPASSITFTAPDPATSAQAYRLFQRNGSNQASVRITGTYVGSPTAIEYRWNGSSWTTLVASPSGGAFDQTVTLQGPAQGALEVRFANDTLVFASLEAVGVGDLFMVLGQSNHVGGGNGDYVPAVAPAAHPGWKATIYAKNGTWRENVETAAVPFSATAGAVYAIQGTGNAWGSYFGHLATLCMAAGVPVGFVPCAIGSTSLASWAASSSTSTLYGAAAASATTVGAHKAVLWWQGEADAGSGTSQATYESGLNALINDWCGTRFSGAKWILMNLNSTGNGSGFDAIHTAIANVAAANANVAAIADMNGAFSSSIHYAATSEIQAVAKRAFGAINSAYAYSAGPAIVSAAVANGAPSAVVLTASVALDPSFTPSASAFTVGGHTVSNVAVSGSTITLTVSPAFAYGEAARTVGYTKSVSDGARAPSGAMLENFSGLEVTNNVANPGGTTGSFTTDQMTSSGTLRGAVTANYEWHAGGTVGVSAGTVTYGSKTLNSNGSLTVTGLPLGAGYILVGFADGGVCYQAGTVA